LVRKGLTLILIIIFIIIVAIPELGPSVGIGSFSGETMRGTSIGVSQDERQ
jgi:hypothetical protein